MHTPSIIVQPAGSNTVGTVAQLRAVGLEQVPANGFYVTSGRLLPGDRLGALYAWTPGSLEQDDGAGVIRPSQLTALQAGRWIAAGLEDSDSALGTLAGAAGSALVGFKQAAADSVPRTVQSVLREGMVSVEDFPLAPYADYTGALRKALATGRSVYLPQRAGGYPVSDELVIASAGQRIVSDSPNGGYLRVTPSFNMGALGVVRITVDTRETHAGLHNVGFVFEQPANAATMAELVHYPWAVYAAGAARMHWSGVVRISGAWNGIFLDAVHGPGGAQDIVGNVGGSVFGHVEIGAFNRAYYIDDAFDSVHFETLKLWPFGAVGTSGPVGNLYNLYSSSGNLGGYIGRVDGLDIKTLAHFRAPLTMAASASYGGAGFGTIASMHMDGDRSNLTYNDGVLRVGAYYTTTSLPAETKIVVAGGKLALGKPWILGPGLGGTAPLISQTNGTLHIESAHVEALGDNQKAYYMVGGSLDWRGGVVAPYPDRARGAPMLHVQAGRATIKCPRFTDVGNGSGLALKVDTDNWHDIEINALLGWGRSVPTPVQATYKFGSTVMAPAL